MTADPSKTKPIPDRRLGPRDWSISDVPERQCSAHKRDGSRCKNAAIQGGTVCGYHGGNGPAVKATARLRLEMASDRLARQLLNMTSDPNVADPVKLAAIKDALDRSGLAAKNRIGRSRDNQTLGSGFRGNLPNHRWPKGFREFRRPGD